MGHQLWTSPVTGYRRKGTRLAELRSLLGTNITARAVLEPLQSCPADAPALEMAAALKRRDFDVAGAQERRDGPVIGFVHRAELKGQTVREHVHPLRAEHLISEATPLGDLLGTLSHKERAFILAGPDVRGIVTRADLNKPPVRVYLFGLVSLLEMHLTFWIRATYEGDSWQKALTSGRLKAAHDLLTKRGRSNPVVSLLDCLQLCDKRELTLQQRDLRGRLGFGDRRTATRLMKDAEVLRNHLAHSQQDLVQGSSWPDLIRLVQQLEAVVDRSDVAVEADAAGRSASDDDGLWASA